eukprot:COSAG01_NODE_60205_length_296_cov_0.527919_1_plen_27_part_01
MGEKASRKHHRRRQGLGDEAGVVGAGG